MNLAALKKPRKLRAGDTIAVATPSWGGPGTFPHRFEAGLNALRETFGFTIVEMAHTRADPDWLANNPKARAEDLMAAFRDPAIAGIFAAIGGDDAVRLVPHLDLSAIAQNPKPIVGYSDTTAIHFACLAAGVQSFYGPAVMSGFAENGGVSATTERGFRAALMEDGEWTLPWAREGWTDQHLDWGAPENQTRLRDRKPSDGPRVLQGSGRVKGRLIGGCFEVLEMIKATPWWPDPSAWDGAVLFFESSEDAPAADLVRRWLRNYGAQDILARATGMMLSRPGNMDAAGQTAQEAAVVAALAEWGRSDMPVIGNLDFGHTDPIVTLPYGAMATLDCADASVRIDSTGP